MIEYDIAKAQTETAFHRELSDKEFAETLLERLKRAEDNCDYADRERQRWHDEVEELRKQNTVSDRWFEMIQKVESIMAIPAEEHVVRIEVGDYTGIEISFEVKGWKDDSKTDD